MIKTIKQLYSYLIEFIKLVAYWFSAYALDELFMYVC